MAGNCKSILKIGRIGLSYKTFTMEGEKGGREKLLLYDKDGAGIVDKKIGRTTRTDVAPSLYFTIPCFISI